MGNDIEPTHPPNRTPTYAALITISLPGGGQAASAAVVLSEGDTIPDAGEGRKPLRDCTLADLQTFANQLEAEVWETYQTIRLVDLETDEGVDVDVTLMGETGDIPLTGWDNWSVKLMQAETAVSAPREETTDESETAVTEEPKAKEEIEAPAPPAEGDAETKTASPSEPETAAKSEAAPEATATEIPAPEVTVQETPPRAEEPVARPVLSPEEITALVREGGLPPRPAVRIAGERLTLKQSGGAAPNIFIAEPALRAAQNHALSSLNREVAGVLVGPRPEKQPDGRYDVYVTDTIIARHTVMHGASVTYTPESWRYLNDELEQRYPEETAVMVGWYHTHPGFGIFLSGMDQFIHRNFFTQIWHIALVLDPVAHVQGFFSWDREQTAVNGYPFPWPRWARSW
jgi:proteasome lid subunit RPN8/RPN11